jgi:hypothetical protein
MIGLSRKTLDECYPNAIERREDLPQYILDARHPLDDDIDLPDYAGVLQRGWQWVFEPMRKSQPSTFAELERLNPRLEFRDCINDSHFGKQWWGDLLLELGGRFFPVFPYHRDEAPGEPHDLRKITSYFDALPEPIATAHFSRIAGMSIVHEVPYNDQEHGRMWPCKVDLSIRLSSGALQQLDGSARSVALDVLRDVAHKPYESEDKLMRGFDLLLDTRKADDYSASGEILFVESDRRNSPVWVIRDLDFSTIRVLSDPVDWLDRFTAAMLRRMQLF